jgi:hypothetical protein
MMATNADRQEALDRKEIRDDAEYWRLSDEIEAAHPDWDGARIYDEIVRRMTEGVEED